MIHQANRDVGREAGSVPARLNVMAISILLSCMLCGCVRDQTTRPYRGDIIEAVYASGKIVSANEYYASVTSGGIIRKKLVEAGSTVKTGAAIYEIENEVESARLQAAQSAYLRVQTSLSSESGILSELKLAVSNADEKYANDSLTYKRLNNLFEKGIGTRSALDLALANFNISRNNKVAAEERYLDALRDMHVSLKNAKSQQAAARADLRKTIVRSEIDGTVYEMMKEPGELVRPNEPVALIGSSGSRLVELDVDQQDILKVKPGQQVLLTTDATGETIYRARVQQIYPSMDEASQTFRIDAVLVDSACPKYIHSSVEANIIVEEKKDALLIPRTAIMNNDSVQLKTRNGSMKVHVKVGVLTRDIAEIISGLSEKDVIISAVKN